MNKHATRPAANSRQPHPDYRDGQNHNPGDLLTFSEESDCNHSRRLFKVHGAATVLIKYLAVLTSLLILCVFRNVDASKVAQVFKSVIP